MIKVDTLINLLKKNNTNFFTGVPDSVLKELSSYLKNQRNHIIATNEGSAVSIGIGHYLSTKNSMYLHAKFGSFKCFKSIYLLLIRKFTQFL